MVETHIQIDRCTNRMVFGQQPPFSPKLVKAGNRGKNNFPLVVPGFIAQLAVK